MGAARTCCVRSPGEELRSRRQLFAAARRRVDYYYSDPESAGYFGIILYYPESAGYFFINDYFYPESAGYFFISGYFYPESAG